MSIVKEDDLNPEDWQLITNEPPTEDTHYQDLDAFDYAKLPYSIRLEDGFSYIGYYED